MRASKGESDELLRFSRAPVDRLFVGCVIAATLIYAGWLIAMRLWPGEPEPEARQGFHGFVTGSSQPPMGGGEVSPAEAGEYGSSKLGTSHYFGGATPRPIAEGAREVAHTELPEPAREAESLTAAPPPVAAQPEPESSSTAADRELGYRELVQRLLEWIAEQLRRGPAQ